MNSFLIAVLYRGRIRLSLAGRDNGNPQQAGLALLHALRNEFKLDEFKSKIHLFKAKAVVLASGSNSVQRGARPISFNRLKVEPSSLSYIDSNPLDLINIIQNASESQSFTCMLDYAGDTRNIQWGYVLNLDELTFEVYKGFNKIQLKVGDTFHLAIAAARHFNRIAIDGEQFSPLIKFKSYPLNNLPDDHKFSGIHLSAFFSIYYNERIIATTDQRYFGSPSLLGSTLVKLIDYNYQHLPTLYEKVELIKGSQKPYYGNAIVLLESLLETNDIFEVQEHAEDASFNDFGYVLNLDTETLDFYRNFVTLDLKDRVNGAKLLFGNIRVASFDLYNLPTREILGNLTEFSTKKLLKIYGSSLR